jgi:hypothetical protein
LTTIGGSGPPKLTAEAIGEIVARELDRVEHELVGAERARAIASLAAVALRAVEATETNQHLSAIQAVTAR